MQYTIKFKYVGGAESEFVLVGLVFRAGRVIGERRAGLLNVVAENMGDLVIIGKVGKLMDALAERLELVGVDVETTGIHGVAGKQNGGAAVVEGDGIGGVAGDRGQVERATTEIDS